MSGTLKAQRLAADAVCGPSNEHRSLPCCCYFWWNDNPVGAQHGALHRQLFDRISWRCVFHQARLCCHLSSPPGMCHAICAPFSCISSCHGQRYGEILYDVDELADGKNIEIASNDRVNHARCVDALKSYKQAKQLFAMHTIPFVSVNDYFYALKYIATAVQPLKERAVFYLAAAVSDFFIPDNELVEHKIQSHASVGQGLTLSLKNVPKLLGLLRYEWAPDAFYVSFKLETDEAILKQKAASSIASYGMHLVVANELKTRFHQVWLITEKAQSLLEKPEEDPDIELALTSAVSEMHFGFLADHQVHLSSTLPVSRPSWFTKTLQSIQVATHDHKQEIISVLLGGTISVLIHLLQRQYFK
ncbi:hypothetical protein Ae201684P_010249 [Aphanomyces euteiches]|nr:hypothetical protein Ae201684P_010249 [Aphanomyces euteiches]